MSKFRSASPTLIFVLLAVVASTLFYAQFSLNHDTSWYLVSTRMFMDGATLYDDIIEINPPLAFYLTMPGLVLSDLTNLRPATAFFLYVSMLGGLSVLWVYALLSRSSLERSAQKLLVALAMAGCFLIVMQDFGQREHFLLIFAMPYFLYLLFREEFGDLTYLELAALGLTAFFGLALKPYFLVIPAGIIIARFICNRDYRELWNTANIALGIGLVGYLGFIAVVHPLYISDILPTASLIYSAYGNDSAKVLFRPELVALVSVLGLAVLGRKQLDRATWGMLGALTGATIAYLVQFKGWNYHVIPASFFLLMAGVWIAYGSKTLLQQNMLLRILAVISVLFSLGQQLMQGPYPSRTTQDFGKFVKGPGVPVLVLSSNVWVSFPFVNDVEARWTSRFPAQWLLPGAVSLLAKTDCAQKQDLCASYRLVLHKARTAMVEDLVRHRPEVVFIDDREQKSHFGKTKFDYLAFLNEDEEFPKIWRQFDQVGQVGAYQVWARKLGSVEGLSK